LAAVVQNRYFCVHGGIGPSIGTIEEIEAIQRPIDSDTALGVVQMLVWADPSELCLRFDYSARGEGVLYGPIAVREFLKRNNIVGIIRAHECVDGAVMATRMPVLTVFSASNYSAGVQNRSGVAVVDADGRVKLAIYEALPMITREEALFFSLDEMTAPEMVHGMSVPRPPLQLMSVGIPRAVQSFTSRSPSIQKIGARIAVPMVAHNPVMRRLQSPTLNC
jgi:diadenosine tetraphosphatase ApaH/serine/threonine PP2A family protein phosphatase